MSIDYNYIRKIHSFIWNLFVKVKKKMQGHYLAIQYGDIHYNQTCAFEIFVSVLTTGSFQDSINSVFKYR